MTRSSERTEIQRRKGLAPYGLVAGVVCCAAGFLALSVPSQQTGDPRLLAGGVGALVFGGPLLVVNLFRVLDDRPALVLTPGGFIDTTLPFTSIEAAWPHISRAELLPRHFLLHPRHAESVVYRFPFLQQQLLKRRWRKWGSPIAVPLAALRNVVPEDLLALANAYLAVHAEARARDEADTARQS